MGSELSRVVDVQAGFKAAVDVLYDLDNVDKILGYIPTDNGIKVIEQVFDYLNPHVSTRPIILTGTYGTGKSHLALVIANLLRRTSDDEVWKSLINKIDAQWSAASKKISDVKQLYGKPYLIVYLEAENIDWGPGFFDSALVLALKEALQREGIEHVTPTTAFDTAQQRIKEIKSFDHSFKLLEQEVAKKQYYSVDNMELKLKKHDKQALDDFSEIHKEVCAGAPFDRFSGISAAGAYDSIVEALREEGYGGILLIWDEFLPVLRKLIENPLSGEALSFQKFAQKCESAGMNKIISIFVSIRNILEMIDRAVTQSLGDANLRRDAEKISGRFRSMPLGHIDKETYHLVRGVISHKDELKDAMNQHSDRLLSIKNELVELKGQFHEYDLTSEDCKVMVEDLYPLHPMTTLVLSRLTDRVGQKDRTIFTFLCDTGTGTFRDCLLDKEISNSNLPFIYPYELEEYFLPLISQSQDYKPLRRMIKKYIELLNTISPNDEVAGNLLKTILILNAAAIPSTASNLVFALGYQTSNQKQQIEDKLKELKERKMVTKGLADQSWRFFGQNLDVTIDEHLQEVTAETSNLSIKYLFNNAINRVGIKETFRVLKAENYNIDRGNLDRQLQLEFIVSSEIDNPENLRAKIEEQFLDGAYYFVLGYTEDELSMARTKIKEFFAESSNIIFALPSSVYQVQEIIPYVKRLKALQELPNKYPQYKSELREEWLAEESDTTIFLRDKLNDFLDPSKEQIEFFYKGELKDIKAINKVREIVSKMMEDTFPFTPSVAREELIKDEGSDTWRSRYRIPIIDTILLPKGPSLLSQETDRVKKHIIDVLYKYHNILTYRDEEWWIVKPESSPENNAMVRIWEEIESFIKDADTTRPFMELVNKLMLPPFGLKQRTIGLILAPVLREYVLHNNLIMQYQGSPVDKIDGLLFEDRIIYRKQPIKVQYQEVTEKHRLIWHAIAETYGITETDLESTFRAIVNWWRELPGYARNTHSISDHAKKFKDIFFDPLSAHEKDKTELINTILPELVGIEDLSKKTAEEVETITKESLATIKDEFEQAIQKLHDLIKTATVNVFGSEDNLKTYYLKLPEITRKQIFVGDSNKLMEWLETSSSKEFVEHNDFILLGESILGQCQNWNDEHISRLIGHLESAKNQIESYGAGPTGLPDDEDHHLPQGKMEFSVGSIRRIFSLYDNLEDAPNQEQASILFSVLKGSLLPALTSGKITGDEFLSIIYHLLKESENA